MARVARFGCDAGVIALRQQGDPPRPQRMVSASDALGSGRPVVLMTADGVSRFSSQTFHQAPNVEGNDRRSADPPSNGTLTYSLPIRARWQLQAGPPIGDGMSSHVFTARSRTRIGAGAQPLYARCSVRAFGVAFETPDTSARS